MNSKSIAAFCLVKNDRRASPGQGHRLRRLLSEQVGHSGCGSRVTDNPNWFQASKYSFLHSSLSSAESRYHCLQTREQLRRSTQSSCENTRAITCAGARSADASTAAESPPSSSRSGGAMADPPAPVLGLERTSGCRNLCPSLFSSLARSVSFFREVISYDTSVEQFAIGSKRAIFIELLPRIETRCGERGKKNAI